MGEGWGDFTRLLMQVREEDAACAGQRRFQGVYPDGGLHLERRRQPGLLLRHPPRPVLDGHHEERRSPSSTSRTARPCPRPPDQRGEAAPPTPRSTTTGEVWATMLWECYAVAAQRATPSQEAQDRMKRYLVARYKATPNAPTFLEARDALLAAAARRRTRRTTSASSRPSPSAAPASVRKVADRDSTTTSAWWRATRPATTSRVSGLTLDDGVSGCDSTACST